MGLDDRVQYILVDSESQGMISFGMAKQLAAALNARYLKTQDLKADLLVDIAKGDI